MNPRQATAYLKGIRAARTYDIRSGQKPPVCPYERQSLANYWRRGYSDYFEYHEDAMHFLKHANGDY